MNAQTKGKTTVRMVQHGIARRRAKRVGIHKPLLGRSCLLCPSPARHIGSIDLLLSETLTLTYVFGQYPFIISIFSVHRYFTCQHSFAMSHPSPQSSAGIGPASSPYTGTDPTSYSPELARFSRSTGVHRNSFGQVNGKASHLPSIAATPKYKGVLTAPAPYYQGLFANEVSEDDKSFISRFQFVSQLPDGTVAGVDSEHELFSVQHQMKLVGCYLLVSLTHTNLTPVPMLLKLCPHLHSRRSSSLRRPPRSCRSQGHPYPAWFHR